MKNTTFLHRLLIGLCLYLFSHILMYGQVVPEVCDSGIENTCLCETAPLQCPVSDLDGLTYTMSLYQHAEDGPEPMCPGQSGTVSNNPTWIAFASWCEELTLEICYDNCTGGGFVDGLQAAVYSDCGDLPGSIVGGGCATDPTGCIDDGCTTLILTGMTVGDTHYLLVDGCNGSACEVEISVIEDCGVELSDEEIVYNGIDDDCNPLTLDDDLDQDGFDVINDCDDTNPNINPDAEDIPNNDIDEDCDGQDFISSTYELDGEQIEIYPNPVSDLLQVNSTSSLSLELNLFNINGHLVISVDNVSTIDCSQLIEGTYLLKVIDVESGDFAIERVVVVK